MAVATSCRVPVNVMSPTSLTNFFAQRRGLTLLLSLFLLNASLTFRNIWPTPAVWWAGDLSIELAIALLVVLFATRGGRAPSRRLLAALTTAWVIFVFGRYADVTTPALLGRSINLFWDVRFAKDVTAMFVKAAPIWGVLLATIAIVGLIGLLAWLGHRALRRVARAAADVQRERRIVAATAAVMVALFAVERVIGMQPPVLAFARPVTQTYAEQVRMVRDAMGAASRNLPDTPPLDSDLSLVAGADVMLMFMESYGAVTWQRPDFVERLTAPRAELTNAIADTGRSVVSGFVESPTYGGSSWFAHISLLSGLEIRDPNANALLMTQPRQTLVTAFARRGYRTIALMPGLWQAWPEGAFYGFQEMYGGERLAYKGPEFGWWALPDQYTLARFDERELERQPRPPLFVFFPTVSTHTPFTPTPPFQPDWPRMLTPHPFDDAVVTERFDQQPDWTNLSPSYGNAVAYAHEVLAGYLRKNRGRDLVIIVLGDHQPPALVSGEGQPWDVPVHIISSRPEILDRLRTFRFHDGLVPTERISKMHELLPTLLDAFGDRQPEPGRLALVR